MSIVVFAAIIPALLAVLYGGILIRWIIRLPTGDERMRAIARAIQEGASAYLKRQYLTIGVVAAITALNAACVPDTRASFFCGARVGFCC